MGQIVVGLAGAAVGFLVGGPLGAQIGWLAASTVYSLLHPAKVQGPRLTDLHVQTSTYGRPIPIVYGRMRLAGNGCFQTDWVEHEESSGGKGGTEQTNYTYTNSFGFAICEGPILGVIRRWANGKLITDVGYTADEKWPFVLYLGDETQMPDPTIEAEYGAGEVSPMRGIAYEVVTDKGAGDTGNSVPNVEYEVYTKAGDDALARVSTWYPPLDPDSASLTGSCVCGATYYGGTIFYGLYEYAGGGNNYTGYTYDTDGNELTVNGPWTCIQIPDNGFGNGTQTMTPAANCQIAFGKLAAQGANNPEASAWYSGETMCSYPVNNIAGSPRSHDCVIPTCAPFLYKNYLYCIGSTSSTSQGSHVARYPTPLVDGKFTPLQDDDGYYVFPAGLGDYAVTASDDDFIWVIGNVSSDVQLYKFDLELNLLHTWTSSELPATITSAQQFTVHEGRLIYGSSADQVVYAYEIDGSPPFAQVGAGLAYPTQASPRLGAPVIWIGGCYALLEDGLISICGGTGGVPLSEIVTDLCVRGGLDASQVDASDLTQLVTGFVVAGQMQVADAIDMLRRAYFFDGVEVDGQLKFFNRGADSIATIEDDDLGAREFGAEMPTPLATKRVPEAELPRRVWVNYYNGDQDYQRGTQYADRQVDVESDLDITLDLPVVLTDAQALQIANRHLHMAWLEREQFTFTTSRKWAKLIPTDVVTVRGRVIRIVSKNETPNGVITFEGVASAPGEYAIQGGSTGAAGGGFNPQTPPQASVASELVLLDIPLVNPSDHQFGFYAAVGPSADGPWPGAGVYMSRDSGVTYERIGETRTPSVIGKVRVDGTYPDVLGTYALGDVVDETTIRVVLTDDDAELESCTADALTNGANLCAIARGLSGSPSTLKWEICQFRDAVLIAPKQYALTGFVRGRKDSETDDHADLDQFVLLKPLVNIERPEVEIGVEFQYKAVTFGQAVADASPQDFINLGLGRDDFFNGVAGNTPSSIVHHTGTSYTFAEADRGKLHTFANAATVTVTLPAGLREGWWVDIENIGVGDVVLDPANNIDGASGSVTLETDQGLTLRTDGTDYWTMRGVGTGGGGGGSGVAVENEGVSIGTGFTILDFNGAPVTAVDSGGGRAAIVITGQVVTKDDGVTVLAASPTLDFTTGISATNAGGGITEVAIVDFVGDSGSGGTDGGVPAPSAGDAAAGKVLSADGTWKTVGAITTIGSTEYADGSDGAFTADGSATPAWATRSGSVYTMTRNAYLASLTINSGVSIITSGYLIWGTGTLTGVDATSVIKNGGSNSTAGSSGLAGPAGIMGAGSNGGTGFSASNGTASGGLTTALGGQGGQGGASGVRTSPTAGVPTAPSAAQGSLHGISTLVAFTGGTTPSGSLQYKGGTGGSSGGGETGSGGGGGGGGGICAVAFRAFAGAGTVHADGGNGGNGTTLAGGGGGGGGGAVLIRTGTATVASIWTLRAAGGIKGNGAGGSPNGNDGSAGNVFVSLGS